jgi:hypothetical protein
MVLFTVRASHLRSGSGQISFPGLLVNLHRHVAGD